MKKIIVILLFMLTTVIARAQRASLKNDTARYNGISYTVGDTIRLDHGSQADKSFAFISTGTRQAGLADLDKAYATKYAVIEKIFIQRKSVYINAKLVDKTANEASAIKILIDLEAAVDNKEIK